MVWKITFFGSICASALFGSLIPRSDAAMTLAWSSMSRVMRSRACGAATASTAARRAGGVALGHRSAGRRPAPAADQQPAGEQQQGEREHAEQAEPAS